MTGRRTTRDEKIAFAFRNVDTQDLEWLAGRLGFGGHDQFWKVVIRELDSALRSPVGERASPSKEE